MRATLSPNTIARRVPSELNVACVVAGSAFVTSLLTGKDRNLSTRAGGPQLDGAILRRCGHHVEAAGAERGLRHGAFVSSQNRPFDTIVNAPNTHRAIARRRHQRLAVRAEGNVRQHLAGSPHVATTLPSSTDHTRAVPSRELVATSTAIGAKGCRRDPLLVSGENFDFSAVPLPEPSGVVLQRGRTSSPSGLNRTFRKFPSCRQNSDLGACRCIPKARRSISRRRGDEVAAGTELYMHDSRIVAGQTKCLMPALRVPQDNAAIRRSRGNEMPDPG